MIAQIQMRRGTSAEWAAAAPVVLSAGEPGYDTTEKKMKVGDGSTEWADLDFLGASDCPYDVGDILTTRNTASPAVRWPGTVWAAMGAGRVLVGIDPNDTDFDTVGKQGGEKNHTLTIGEMPDHNHPMPYGSTLATAHVVAWASTNDTYPGMATGQAGGGAPHNNLQPYEVVYRYKRTA